MQIYDLKQTFLVVGRTIHIEHIFKHIKTNVLFGRPVVQPWKSHGVFSVPRSELGGASVLSASGLGGVVVPTVYGQAGGLGAALARPKPAGDVKTYGVTGNISYVVYCFNVLQCSCLFEVC